MLDNFARSVQILITLSGNIEEQLKNVSVLLDNLANKKIVINIESINNLTGSADNAAKSINKISDNAKSTEKHTTSSFDNIKKSIDNVNDGIGNLVNSLAGIAIGGSISGLAWKTSAESTLYVEQIERAINSNKKLKISFAELEEFSKSQAEAGEGTRRANIKEYYSILMAGSKYIKGSSTEKLAKADYITDFWFANQELMKAQGFGSAEDLVRSSVRTTGKLTGTRRDALATALGVDPEGKEMSSAKSRMKYMMEMGKDVNMSEALSKRPWEGFATSLKSLKDSIGDSLVWPMNKFVQLLTGAVKLLNSIPGAGLFIGLAGGAIALVSTLTLLNGVLMPGLALLKQMVVWTNLHTAAEVKQMVVSKALIVTDWLGVTSKAARTTATAAAAASSAALTGAIGMEIVALEVDAVATTAAATATTGLAVAEWAALSPLLLLAIPLIAIAGLLYLVETRTHAFSNALDKLSKTEMSKDLIQWLEDVGYWAGYAVDRLGSVIESDLFSKIDSLNSAYTNVKSGNILGILGLGNEKSSETKPSATSQLLGSVGGLPGTNLLTMTKIVTPLSLMQNHLEFIVNVLSWFKNFFSGGNPLTNIYNAIIRLPANIYKSVSEWVSKQIEKVKTQFSEITKFFGDINTGLSTKFGEITSDISTKYNEITTSVSNWFSEITSTITTKYNELLTNASTKFGEITSDISTKFNEIITTITTKITDIISTITTKFEGIFGGGGKTGSELTAAVWEEIKKDPMFSGLSEAQQEYLARTASGEKYWKNDETGEYKYSTASPGEGWRDVTSAGSTEISRGEGIGISSHMKAKANKIAGELRNPAALKLPTLALLAAIQAADKKIADIAKEGQEKADEAIANRDFLGFMINQYSMGAKVIGAMGEGALNLLTGKTGEEDTPSMDAGGTITGSGSIIGHAKSKGRKSKGSSDNKVTGESTTDRRSPHEKEVDSHSGNIDYGASKERGTKSGLIASADIGGLVTKSGIALVHSGEPIIPAEVASSSRLQNILESIAYGGSSSNTYGDINVRINYTPPSSSTSSNMIVMDRISFEHMVSDIIAKRLRQLNGY